MHLIIGSGSWTSDFAWRQCLQNTDARGNARFVSGTELAFDKVLYKFVLVVSTFCSYASLGYSLLHVAFRPEVKTGSKPKHFVSLWHIFEISNYFIIQHERQNWKRRKYLPYFKSQIWASFFLRSLQIFSTGLWNDMGLETICTMPVAEVSVAPIYQQNRSSLFLAFLQNSLSLVSISL